jgi:crossover junction endodeoxyribonuclease RusA
MTLAFTVYGLARTKGNHRAIHLKGMKFPIVTESNRNVASWQQLVAAVASQALDTAPADDRALITGGVRLTVAFYLPRPKKFGKRGVFVHHTIKPDLDRLERAILDALTGIAYRDDKQVTEIVTGKYYAGVDQPAHVEIRAEPAPPGRTGVQPITRPLFEAAG